MLRKVPKEKLAVSEPNPAWFGNSPNENKPNWNNKNWLKSRFHFSFAEYSNSRNTNFGVLRVMNDDLVQPRRGFGAHGHRDAEICTYIIDGQLTHKDSMGTAETLGRGAIQFMTAGRGVRHSEHNRGDKPLRFIQMWLTPRSYGLAPNYGSATSSAGDRTNKWLHLVGDVNDKATEPPVQINTDANIFVTELAPNRSIALSVKAGRQAYCLMLEGQAQFSRPSTSAKPDFAPTDGPDAKAATAGAAVAGDSSATNKDAATNTNTSTNTSTSTSAASATTKPESHTCPSPGFTAGQHDAAEIVGPIALTLSSKGGGAHVLVVEMSWDSRADGRRDM